jgi:serine/threonine protein kinase
MADADWHKYKQLRGLELPESAVLLETDYVREHVLKRDFYATVGIFKRSDGHGGSPPSRVLLKIYHADSLWGFPLGWMGRWLCRREMRFYRLLDGIEGIPRLLGTYGESGLVREFISGCNLREFEAKGKPDARFFVELTAILAAAHARGMSHNDLSKPENILVTDDGRPVIIDYQIAIAPRTQHWPLVGWPARAFVRFMQDFDRYHVNKLHTRARPEDFTAESRGRVREKPLVIRLHGVLRKPYRAVRHAVLRRWLMENEDQKAA